MLSTDILRRIQPTGAVNRVRTAQNAVMNSLLQPQRLDRLVEQAAVDGGDAYTPTQFLADVRKGVWSELGTTAPVVDVFRRNTQRVYLDTLDNRLNENGATSDEVRALLKGELKLLDAQIKAVLPAVTDAATKRHLEDAREQIATTLDPHAMRTPPAPAGGGRGGRGAGTPAPAPGFGQSSSITIEDGEVIVDSSKKFDYAHDPFLVRPAADSTNCWPSIIIR